MAPDTNRQNQQDSGPVAYLGGAYAVPVLKVEKYQLQKLTNLY